MRSAEKGTEMLRDTRRVLQSEFQRSYASREVLEKSSQTIEEVISKHHTYGENLSIGRMLVNKLMRREFTDKILLFLSLLLFSLVVLYIYKVRVLKI